MNYQERLEKYHQKMAMISVEYSAYWNETMERMVYCHSVGFGKPSIVDDISNRFMNDREDLQLVYGWEEHSYRPLPKRKGVIGTPSYRLTKNHNAFFIKDKEMESLLCYYEECQAARRERK